MFPSTTTPSSSTHVITNNYSPILLAIHNNDVVTLLTLLKEDTPFDSRLALRIAIDNGAVDTFELLTALGYVDIFVQSLPTFEVILTPDTIESTTQKFTFYSPLSYACYTCTNYAQVYYENDPNITLLQDNNNTTQQFITIPHLKSHTPPSSTPTTSSQQSITELQSTSISSLQSTMNDTINEQLPDLSYQPIDINILLQDQYLNFLASFISFYHSQSLPQSQKYPQLRPMGRFIRSLRAFNIETPNYEEGFIRTIITQSNRTAQMMSSLALLHHFDIPIFTQIISPTHIVLQSLSMRSIELLLFGLYYDPNCLQPSSLLPPEQHYTQTTRSYSAQNCLLRLAKIKSIPLQPLKFIITTLLSHNANLEQTLNTNSFMTPLLIASLYDNINVIQLLLQHGAQVDPFPNQLTALHYAAQLTKGTNDDDVIDIDDVHDWNYVIMCRNNNNGKHIDSTTNTSTTTPNSINNNININMGDIEHKTTSSNQQTLQLLLPITQQYINERRGDEQVTPILHAFLTSMNPTQAIASFINAIQLFNNNNINDMDNNNDSNTETNNTITTNINLTTLLNQSSSNGYTLLHYHGLLRHHSIEIEDFFQLCQQYHIRLNPNVQDTHGNIPLFYCNEYATILKFMQLYTPNITILNNDQQSILYNTTHLKEFEYFLEQFQLLLSPIQFNEFINHQDINGNTILLHILSKATSDIYRHNEITLLLSSKYNIDISITNNFSYTALHLALLATKSNPLPLNSPVYWYNSTSNLKLILSKVTNLDDIQGIPLIEFQEQHFSFSIIDVLQEYMKVMDIIVD